MPRFGGESRALNPPRSGGLLRLCVIDGAPASRSTDAQTRHRLSTRPPNARSLVILTDPRAEGLTEHDRSAGPNREVIALDPTADHTRRLHAVLETIERLAPERLDAGETDLGRAIETMFNAPRGHPSASPGDALTLWNPTRWNKAWSDDPDNARRWIIETLQRCGARRIAGERNRSSADVVVFEGLYTPEMHEKVMAARRDGIGAVVTPALTPPVWSVGAIQLGAMVRAGARRLAIYGAGAHTRRLSRLFDLDLPILAVLDDFPTANEIFGRPVLTPREASERLGIDAVLISSDALEDTLYLRSQSLRSAGIPVRTFYGACGTRWIDTHAPGVVRSTA